MSEIGPMLLHGLSVAGVGLAWTACAVLCLAGLALAVFSISGTWLVWVAAIGAALLTGPDQFPGWPTLLVFFAVCAAVDVIEWFAASWGVRRRGGSAAAGWMALLGSLGGAILGGMVVPILGSLVGMMVGSFALVYWIEKRRQQKTDRAAHIAAGAVLAAIPMLALFLYLQKYIVSGLTAGAVK